MFKHLLRLLLLAAMLAVPWATQGQSFSFSCDFESDSDTAGWVFANGSQTNQWFIGSATSNGGSKSLYISNNGGTSNAYTVSTVTFAYAYKEFTLSAGGYAISYDWKCYGEGNYDYIRVFLAPSSFNPTPGQDPTGGTSAYSWSSASLPSGFISLSGANKLNLQSNWQNHFEEFTVSTPGTYRLVFAWANDASAGTTPPGAIDNIIFEQPTCPRPSNLQFANVLPHSFDISWTEAGTASSWLVYVDSAGAAIDSSVVYDTMYSVVGRAANTAYNVRVASLCDAGDTSMWLSSSFRTPCAFLDSLPFFEDFEDSPTGSSTTGSPFAYCWTRLNNGTSSGGYPYVSSSSTYNHTPGGNKGLYWYNTTTTGTYGDYQTIVMPGVDTNYNPIRTLQVRFWARASSTSYSPVLQVGVLTNPNDNSTFELVSTVNVGNSAVYAEYEVPLGTYADTGCYVAIRALRPSSSWYVYLDDVTLERAPTCPRMTELSVAATVGAARISWDYSDQLGFAPDYFELSYRYTDDTLGTPTTVTTNSLSYILNGLDPDTSYTVTVTPNCGDGGFGQPLTRVFSTAALPCLEWDTTSGGGGSSPAETYAVGTPGTSTNNVMPVNGEYNYSYCNHLILASEVNSGAVYFSGIDFDYGSSTPMTATTNCSIYMCHTTMATCTDFAPVADLQLVYEGPINCTTNGWNHFEFNRGTFAYNGTSNIMVAIVKNSGALEPNALFRYQQTSGSMTHRVYRANAPYTLADMAAATASASYWRTNMRLTTGGNGGGTCLQTVDCAAPSIAIDSIHSTDVSISWIPGYQETTWDVDYRLSTDTAWTNAAMAVTATDYTITGLQANSNYVVRVMSLCSDTNIAAQITFRTHCGGTPVPFHEGFDTWSTATADPLPDCWYKRTNYSTSYPYASTSYNHNVGGSKAMYMYSTNTTWSYMVLPEFIPTIDSLQVRFWLYKSNTSYNHRLIVGVITDENDETTFVPVDTVQNSTTSTWEEFTIPMDRYVDTISGARIAIMSPDGEYSYPYLDELTVEYIPDCPAVDNLEIVSITGTTADIAWEEIGDATSWTVELGPAGFTLGTGTTTYVYDTIVNLVGLTPNTNYDLYVTPDCPSGVAGTAYITFHTSCGAYPVPFSEGFDTWSSSTVDPLPQCWYKKTNYSTSYPYASTSYNHNPGGSKALYMYSTSTTWSYMVLPDFEPSLDSLQVRFWLYKSNTSYNHRLYVGVITAENNENTFIPIDTVQNSALSTWEEFTVSFANYVDTIPGARIAIMSPNGEYSYPYLDDLTVEYIPDCPPVDNLAAINITGYSADIKWEEQGDATSWTLVMGPSGFADGAGDTIYAYDTIVNLFGLTPNTNYDVYVTTDCADGIGGTAYTSFHTSCLPASVPFTEGFDTWSSSTADPLPQCWYKKTNYSTSYPYASTSYNHNPGGSKALYMYSTNTTWSYMVLPDFEPTIDSLQVRFWLYKTNTSYNHRLIVGVITNENDESTFVPIDTVQNSALSAWEEFTVSFANYVDTTPGARIAIMSPSGEYSYPYLDDLTVEYAPDCPSIDNLTLTAIDSNYLTLTWTEMGTATSWTLEYGPAGFTPGSSAGTTVSVTSLPYTITGLTANTLYDVYVSPDCASGIGGVVVASYRTANSYVGLPFVCNFENTTQNNLWTLENGSVTNKWYVGTAAHNGGGHGLYISNTNGSTNNYDGASSSVVYAYVDLMLSAPGDYGYSFDWKCQGESTFDFLRAALVPVSQSFSAGTALPSGLSATAMPSDWISLDGNTKLNLNSTWQTQSDVISVPNAGVYHLLFVWRNDGSVTNQPPIAIDNVEIMRLVCSRPTGLTISNLTQTSADFEWHEAGNATEWQYQLGSDSIYTVYDTTASITGLSANTTYTFKVRSVCDDSNSSFWLTYNFRTPCGSITLPYTEDFESYSTGSSSTGSAFVNCWYRLNNGTSYGGYPYVSSSSSYNHTPGGTKGLYWYNTTTTGTYGDYQCVVLPPVDSTISVNTLQLSFWAKASSSSYVPIFKIGVMTDPNDITSFVGVDTVTITGTTWQNVEVPLALYAGTGQYVAVKADRPSSSWYAYVDDFTLDYIPTCIAPRDVHATAATTSTITIDWTDITSAYEWQIEYGPQGYTRGSAAGTAMTVTAHPVMLTGLDTLTNYDVYVRPICSVGDTARWYYPTPMITAMCDNTMTVDIGSTSSATTTYYAPLNNYYNYSLTETIIDSAEIGGPMDIEYIGYYYDYSSPSTLKTNCTIYFQPTTLSTFASTSSAVALDSSAVRVYTGSLNCQEGWNFFRLDTVYSYNGLSNLMIIVDDNSGDYDGSSYVFKTSPCSGSKTLYYYSDDDDPSPTSPSSFDDLMDIASWRPVTQLVSCSGTFCPVPIITSETHDYHSATITWNGTGSNYEVNIKETSAINWPSTDIAVTGTTYTFTGLNPETAYTFRVRQDCTADSNDYSEWYEGSFVTDSLPCLSPDSLVVSDLTNVQGTFSWTVRGNESVWDIHVWNTGGLDSVYRVTTNPATVGGFTAGVTYNAAIRPICGVELIEGDYGDTIHFTSATCPDVTGLTSSNVTESSVTLNWTADPMAESWQIEYGFAGFAQGTGTSVTTNVNTYVVTGLEDESSYDFYVRAICGTDWNSEGWAHVSATTPAASDPTYTVTVTVNDAAMGSATGGGTYRAGQSCTVTATPNSGYHFVSWSNGVTDNPYTFTVVANITLTATFAANGTEGIEDVAGDALCTIYPNPTSDVTTISVSGVNGMVRITVVDMNGRTVATETLECSSDCEKTMDVANLAQGAYFVKITGERVNLVKKLVVR